MWHSFILNENPDIRTESAVYHRSYLSCLMGFHCHTTWPFPKVIKVHVTCQKEGSAHKSPLCGMSWSIKGFLKMFGSFIRQKIDPSWKFWWVVLTSCNPSLTFSLLQYPVITVVVLLLAASLVGHVDGHKRIFLVNPYYWISRSYWGFGIPKTWLGIPFFNLWG